MPTLRAERDTQPGPGQLPWAVHILVRVIPDRVYSFTPAAEGLPVGYVLMHNEQVGLQAPTQLLWGFRESFDRCPLQTALHVVEKNIGLKVAEPSRIKQVRRLLGNKRLDSGNESHWKYLFCIDISETNRGQIDPRHRNETLRPYMASSADFYRLLASGGLYEPHRVWLEQEKLIAEDQFKMTG